MASDRPRGALVDRCHRCGTWLRRASADQHAVLQGVLEDIALQLPWPPQAPALHGPEWWWEMLIPAFDRLKKQEVEVVPAIDGIGAGGLGFDFVRGARRRRNLNNVEISEVIEYSRAWAIDQGVTLREFKEKKRAA